MVAEKNNEMSGTALAALVRALHNKQSVALVLFMPRVSEKTGGNPAVCAGTPVLVREHLFMHTCNVFLHLRFAAWLRELLELHLSPHGVQVCAFRGEFHAARLACLLQRISMHAKPVCVEQGNGAGPDHLVLNHLPFLEDLRVARFTSFEAKADLLPSEQQVQCISDLVQSLDLQSGSISAPASCTRPLLAHDVLGRRLDLVTTYKDNLVTTYKDTCSL